MVLFIDTYENASASTQKWVEDQLLPRMDRMPGGVPREGVGGHLLVRGSY